MTPIGVVYTRTVDAGDGLELHVECVGDGHPLLLLHGFTGDTTSWRSLTAALCDTFMLVRLDLPGHGLSTSVRNPSRYDLVRFASDLARVLDELQLPHAAVLGYSLGGRAALRLALGFPERVSALVLESTSAGIRDAHERAERRAADAALADEIEREGVPAFVDRWERLPLWESQHTMDEAVRRELRAQRLRRDPVGLANSLRGAGAGVTQPVHDSLGSIRCRTLLVAGELDVRYVAHSREMARLIPGSRMETIASAGHAVHLERPDRFAHIVRNFLTG